MQTAVTKALFAVTFAAGCAREPAVLPSGRPDARTGVAGGEDLATTFNQLADAWKIHCKSVSYSSFIAPYLDSPAYRGLVRLGPPAIPLIMERYKRDDCYRAGPRSEFVLDEITGFKMIADGNNYSPPDVRRRYIAWWEAELRARGVQKNAKTGNAKADPQ